MASKPDIIIIAHRRATGSDINYIQSSSSATVPADYGRAGGSGVPRSDGSATVNIWVTDANNLAGVTDAAQNVAAALVVIQEKLESIPSNTPINWNGNILSAGAILAGLRNIQFIITDQTYEDGGGVGAASYGTRGQPTRDYLDFRAFTGLESYASPNYTNGQGMNGIMLH